MNLRDTPRCQLNLVGLKIFVRVKSGNYPRPRPLLPRLLLLPLLPRLLPDEDEPEDREGGDTEDPRELLLPEERDTPLLGREDEAGRVLLPEEPREDEGRALLPEGRLEVVPDGRTDWPVGRRDVPLLTASELRVPREVLLGRTASRPPLDVALPRVTEVRPVLPEALLATGRVEMRPFASREMAVRVDVRAVREPIRSREEERGDIRRSSTT